MGCSSNYPFSFLLSRAKQATGEFATVDSAALPQVLGGDDKARGCHRVVAPRRWHGSRWRWRVRRPDRADHGGRRRDGDHARRPGGGGRGARRQTQAQEEVQEEAAQAEEAQARTGELRERGRRREV